MNISYEWLSALVPGLALEPAKLRDLITMRCATVDELLPLREDLAPIVIARVVECARHPDSDHLSVTKVDAGGGELLDVVCGAPNVRAGALYPFAPVGTTMPGGLKIEKRKIRGALSQGMLCSSRELGLGEDHEGILELAVAAAPGTRFLDAIPVGDTRLVLDVTPNRPDLLSHFGVAREVAAALGREPTLPDIPNGDPAPPPTAVQDARQGVAGPVTVRVEDADGAPRYMGVVIRGVRVAQSPPWLVNRLHSVGARAINNVVDATNYLLHELGQPAHAFDLARLGGQEVIVRRARTGERLVTLDGVARALDSEMTVIADAQRPHAVAGVMGGAESEVSDTTTDIFLEVACFDPARTRQTRRRLGLSTDASQRFERGVDIALAPRALQRAVRLIRAIAGGAVDGTPVDVYPTPAGRDRIVLRVSRVARLLGERVAPREIIALLRSIGFVADLAPGTEMLLGGEEIHVVPPTWRPDVTAEVDLIEEVARLHGYDAFATELRPYRPGTVPDDAHWTLSRRVREALVSAGLYETRPIPFVAGGDDTHVRVTNPIAGNEAHLRRSILETLAGRAEYNLSHMQGNVRIFEIGNVFAPSGAPLPLEELRVGVLVMGERRPSHFTEPKPPAFDEWDAKALGELVSSSAYPGAAVALERGEEHELWTISVEGAPLGSVRRVAIDAPVWAAQAFGIELSLGVVPSADVAPRGSHAHGDARAASPAAAWRPYRPLPSTPAVELDLALVVPDATPAADVERVIRNSAGDLLESMLLFDRYAGPGVPSGHRSLAWRLTFRHPERTLGAKEVEGRRGRILRTLEGELGIRQRTG